MAITHQRSQRARLMRSFIKEIEDSYVVLMHDFGSLISGFSIAHWRILMIVWERSGEISETEARNVISELPKLSSLNSQRQIVKDLSQAGMIMKALDTSDERRRILHITEKAAPEIEKYFDRIAKSISKYAPKI